MTDLLTLSILVFLRITGLEINYTLSMKNIVYKKIWAVSMLIGGMLFAIPVFAAQVALVPSTQSLYEKQEFYIDILLDPQSESINTVAADIVLSDNIVYLGNNDYKSIIGEWVESPKISVDGHTLHFAGIVPGGFAGYIDPFNAKIRKPGLLLRLFVKASGAGISNAVASNVHTYINDGLGTEVQSSSTVLALSVIKGVGVVQHQSLDTEPPFDFVPVLVHDAQSYEGKYTVTFSTKDADSGIDHYEIKEGNSDWANVTSPYTLKNQTLEGQVLIKAIDRIGNTKIEQVPLPIQDRSGRGIQNWIAVVVVFIALYVIILWRRWLTKKHTT